MNASRRFCGQLVALSFIGAAIILFLAIVLPSTPFAVAIALVVLVLGLGLAGLIDSCLQVRDVLRELARAMDKEPAGRGLLRTVLGEHAAEEEQAAEARAAELLAPDGPPPQTAVKKAGES